MLASRLLPTFESEMVLTIPEMENVCFFMTQSLIDEMTFGCNDCIFKYLHFPRCLLQITIAIKTGSK